MMRSLLPAGAFGSGDLPAVIRKDLKEVNPESEEEIKAYNRFASDHEHLMSKSLFCAGTTWPGVFTAEDQRALDYLCSRDDVDPARVGCAGLSGGGLRTVYLAGLDDRIRCACCVGMMTTWRDYLLNKCSYAHVDGLHPGHSARPRLSRDPRPASAAGDPGSKRQRRISSSRSARCTAPTRSWAKSTPRRAPATAYKCTFYPGPHKFDRPMQAEAFAWFERWLKVRRMFRNRHTKSGSTN